jgi:quercetin dioxygenase-like cupin family protein
MAALHGQPRPVSSPEGSGAAELLVYPSGDTVRILLDGRTSYRALTVLDCTHVAGPTEPHVHTDAHKSVYVVAGRYRFRVGDDVTLAAPGDAVFVPRGVAHDFTVGIEGGRALFVFSPGGVDQYFRDLAAMVDSGAGASAVDIDELRRRHHIEAVDD